MRLPLRRPWSLRADTRRSFSAARLLTVGPAAAVVVIALALPLLLMLTLSFSTFVPGRITDYSFTVANYLRLLTSSFYWTVLLRTLEIGGIVTAVSMLIGYPAAYWLARSGPRTKAVLSYLLLAPLMVGIVVRAYGWMIVLGHDGLLNTALLRIGVLQHPAQLLYTPAAVVIGLVEILVPFAVIPMASSIERIDRRMEEAARVLGAKGRDVLWRVTIPLSGPGIVSGALIVFSLSITAYALPALLGGGKVQLASGLAYSEMLVSFNYPFGSAIGIFLVVVATAIVFLYLRLARRMDWSGEA